MDRDYILEQARRMVACGKCGATTVPRISIKPFTGGQHVRFSCSHCGGHVKWARQHRQDAQA